MEKIKEYYCVKVLGTKKDLLIRFFVMTAMDFVVLYALSFIQDILYDADLKVAYSDTVAYILISLWVFFVFCFMIMFFKDYIDVSRIDKVLFKK